MPGDPPIKISLATCQQPLIELGQAANHRDRNEMAPAGDNHDLTLRVPNDGSVAALRRVLEQLDDAGVEIAQLSIHTPDLDDVFFAVTGRSTAEEGVLS